MEAIAYRLALGFVAIAALGRVGGIYLLKCSRQRRYARRAVAYQMLEERLGDAYRSYRHRVGMIVPRLRRSA